MLVNDRSCLVSTLEYLTDVLSVILAAGCQTLVAPSRVVAERTYGNEFWRVASRHRKHLIIKIAVQSDMIEMQYSLSLWHP